MTGSRPMSRHLFASSFAFSGGASFASMGTSLPTSLCEVPHATKLYPAPLIPSSARASGKCEYGSVMHAIWNFVGFFSSAALARLSGGRKPPVSATVVPRKDRRFIGGSPSAAKPEPKTFHHKNTKKTEE